MLEFASCVEGCWGGNFGESNRQFKFRNLCIGTVHEIIGLCVQGGMVDRGRCVGAIGIRRSVGSGTDSVVESQQGVAGGMRCLHGTG